MLGEVMRCPNCGEEVRVGKTSWECEWCGDSGMVQRVPVDEPETNAVTVTVTATITVTENDEPEGEDKSAPEEQAVLPLDPERAKCLLAAGDFPEDDDICREILVGAYPDEIEEFDESGESLCWNILYDIFECDPEKAIEMWRYLLDIAGDLLKTDTETAEVLLPDWDLFDPPDEYAIKPLFDALSDGRFAEQIFGSAYVGSLQPDILRVCFDNGAEELGRRCLAIALANPYLSKRRTEIVRGISDEFVVELPETAPGGIPDDGTIFHYCSVMVNVSSRPYAYLTGGLPLKFGDIVEVPFGSNNAVWRGEVVEVMDCTRATAPWSPEKTKTVKRVVTHKTVEPPREDKPGLFEKTNVRKEFPYGKLIAGILIADVIAIIALIAVNRSVRRERVDADVLRVTFAVVTTAEITDDTDENSVDMEESTENSEDLLKARYSGSLPVDGMPVSCLEYTSIGAQTKIEKCKLYDSMDVHRRHKILHWYNSEGQTVAYCQSHIPKDSTDEIIYAFTYYEKPIGRPSFAPPLKPSGASGSNGGSWSVRDDYDSPEDFWEDNMDAFEDEDEAFDYWYDD